MLARRTLPALALLNLVLVLAVIAVNALAVALPLNGRSTAAISDSFKALFVPAGWVFSIWGLIYLGLLAFAVFQLLPSWRENNAVRSADGWFILSCLANGAWLFAWHYGRYPLSLLVMAVLLVSLILVYARLHRQAAGRPAPAVRLFVRLPFSIYLGWITVATLANLSDVLSGANVAGLGHPNAAWAAGLCIVAGAAGLVMGVFFRDLAFAAVLVWALAGIMDKQSAYPLIVQGAAAGMIMSAAGLAIGFFLLRAKRRR